jgi:hypothetical protein
MIRGPIMPQRLIAKQKVYYTSYTIRPETAEKK